MRTLQVLAFSLSVVALSVSPLSAADAKWLHATSAHFDIYTSESESDAKALLAHLEATRVYFLAATHTHDPGTRPVRIVVFHNESDYLKYKPIEAGTARIYGLAAGSETPGTIAMMGLKPDVFDHVLREYAQLALDSSFPMLPYWFRAGLSSFYSTMKPGDNSMTLGAAPRSNFRNGEVGDINLTMLFGVSREALLASTDKADSDFNATVSNMGGTNGAKSGSRDPGGSSATALEQVKNNMTQSQDFSRAAWMLVHMLILQPDYRAKFGEFMGTLVSGVETGTAIAKVYDRPLSRVKTDLVFYANQTGIRVVTAPFKFEKPPAPEVRSAAKEEMDRVFADLSKRPTGSAQ